MKKKMILVDGSSIVYRTFFALKNFRTSEGLPTNAIYGYTSIILKVRKENPEYGAIIFDSPVKTFRHKEYEKYKATRKKMPEELSVQIPYIKQISMFLGFNILEIEGYEADDVIGTICKKMSAEKDVEIFIISGDLDVLQLVNENVKVMLTKKGISDILIYDIEKVYEKYDGLTPSQIPDFKALKGDLSDNIPGVSGIGEKTALKLLKEYGTLENIFKNLGKMEGREKEFLEKGKETAMLSRFLATIKDDVPLEIDRNNLKIKEIDRESLKEILKKLEFKTILERIEKISVQLSLC